MKTKLLNRFLRYVSFDTQSDENSDTYPSTKGQLIFGKLLANELKTIGLKEVSQDTHGYVTATLPSNNGKKNTPVIAFLSHMDTSPEISGKNIRPNIIENYDGNPIPLNKKHTLSVEEYPELKQYLGQTIITTDGTTLLGADDKAGIAEIITAIEYLINNPQIEHGTIKIAFTPDEEIGKGVDHFDVKAFAAEYAYTIDGAGIGELEYENFNAALAEVVIHGRNIHPGSAKNKMINAISLASELIRLLPQHEKPEHTEGYEGFYHPYEMTGSVEKCTLKFLIRDHNADIFEKRKTISKQIVEFLNEKYGKKCIEFKLTDQYFNMKSKLEDKMHMIEKAKSAMEELGITPVIQPIRGGTDGARLSYMGLPCPNLFTGGHNFHGRYEFISLESMQKATEVIIKLIEKYNQ